MDNKYYSIIFSYQEMEQEPAWTLTDDFESLYHEKMTVRIICAKSKSHACKKLRNKFKGTVLDIISVREHENGQYYEPEPEL